LKVLKLAALCLPRRWKVKLQDIKQIAVIGSGIMGPGIALDFAKAGHSVVLIARRQASIDSAQKVVHANLLTLVKNDVIKADDVAKIEKSLSYSLNMSDAVKDADFIVECINEKKDMKAELFKQLDSFCKKDALFGSNTSYLNIFEVVPESRIANTVITHWFAPAHILPLVEVVREPRTSDETEQTVLALLRGIGKSPILMKKYVPGHAINRLLRIIGREVFNLLDNGYITADQLDLAVKASIAPRMCLLGVVQRYDFTGLDLSAGNLRLANYPEPPVDNAPKSLCSLVEKGDLGVKTGKGFFDYTDKPLEQTLAERDDNLIRILKATEFALKNPPKPA
jgi:3-hydroxybutyryl-CoA dehydrogenase